MGECEHKWHFYEESIDGCFCVRGCRGRLGRGKAEAMLNEYAALKRENERLQMALGEFDDALLTAEEQEDETK